MSEASSAYSDSEVESDDQGSIFSTLSKDERFVSIAFEEDLSWIITLRVSEYDLVFFLFFLGRGKSIWLGHGKLV